MIEEKDVWFYFQKAKGKEVNYPSDGKWESVKKRLSSDNQEKIEELTKYFNTRWNSINIEQYFRTGFKLWKTFSYQHFLRPEIMKKYKSQDKREKRKKVANKGLLQSISFVIKERGSLNEYGQEIVEDDFLSLPVFDYLQNRIDYLLLSFMIERGLLKINNDEWKFIPYIYDRYDDIKKEVKSKWEILTKLEEKTMSQQNNQDNYLEKPKDNSESTQERLLYGDETVEEIEERKKEYKNCQLNE